MTAIPSALSALGRKHPVQGQAAFVSAPALRSIEANADDQLAAQSFDEGDDLEAGDLD
jgi:hypothetical protein